MTNPQLTENLLTENLLAVIRSLPADDRSSLLRQLEQDNSDLSHGVLAEMAMAGGAFNDLATELLRPSGRRCDQGVACDPASASC